jgi:hypothetical protein
MNCHQSFNPSFRGLPLGLIDGGVSDGVSGFSAISSLRLSSSISSFPVARLERSFPFATSAYTSFTEIDPLSLATTCFAERKDFMISRLLSLLVALTLFSVSELELAGTLGRAVCTAFIAC